MKNGDRALELNVGTKHQEECDAEFFFRFMENTLLRNAILRKNYTIKIFSRRVRREQK
jgi:hypothetical protein